MMLRITCNSVAYKEEAYILRSSIVIFALIIVAIGVGSAQESPYIVTYDHHLEEPGNLEIETYVTLGVPRSAQSFYAAPWM
jgi:hypothetical protein